MPNLYLRKDGKKHYTPLVDVTSSSASDLIIRHGGQTYAVAKIPYTQVGNLDLYDLGGNSWTVSGSPTISTAQSKFGGKSLYNNNSTSYISYPDISTLGITTNFTIDCWLYLTANTNTTMVPFQTYNTKYGIGNGKNKWVCIGITNELKIGPAFYQNDHYQTPVSLNTWYHTALTYDGTNAKFFLNGVLQTTVTLDITLGGKFFIGGCAQSSNYFPGYIDEFRISNIARWTENFTPPTAPYTLDDNTLVLLETG